MLRLCSRRFLWVSLAMLLVAGLAAAAMTEIWIYTFTSDGTFGGLAVVSDGSVFWVGQEGKSNFIERFDADGVRTMRSKVKGRDVPSRVALMPDETMLIVAGESRPTKDSFPVPWIAGYNLKGKQQWDVLLEELELGGVVQIVVSPDGQDIYVTGNQSDFDGPDRIFVARLSADGDVVWMRTYENGRFPKVHAIGLDPKKGALVCVGGEAGDLVDPPYLEALLVCFDTEDGSIDWEDLSGSANGWDSIAAMVISPNGKKIWVVGYEDVTAADGDRRWFFQQFKSKNGKGKKRRRGMFLGSGADMATQLAATDSGFYMAGEGCVDFQGRCDAYLQMLNRRGKAQGDPTIYSPGGSQQATPEAIVIGPDGNPIWGGQVDAYDGPMWLQKLMR